MEYWEGSLHESIQAAAVEAEDARIAIEDAGSVVTDVNIQEHESGYYQPTFTVWSQEEWNQAHRGSWVPWVVTGAAVLVISGAIVASVVIGE